MSAADNKKLIEEVFAAISTGDRRRYVDLMAEGVTMTVTGEHSWSQTFRGKEAVLRDLYGVVASRAPERKTIPFRILADEDWVVVEARGAMVTTEGTPYRNHYCLLYRINAGKLVEIR